MKQRPVVALVNQTVLSYRASFHIRLSKLLAREEIHYRLISGNRLPSGIIPEVDAICIPARSLGRTVWQNLFSVTGDTDLLIMDQGVRQFALYPLFLKHILGKQKLAFWGHGKNFQARNPNSPEERLKRYLTRHAHWFFAYNNMSARVVRELGFPENRTTIMMNAIDTSGLSSAKAALTDADHQHLRSELGIRTNNVGVYTGAMYADKRMPFLLDACREIRKRVPDFEMIFIGGGDDAPLVEREAQKYPWMHFVGYKNNEEKVPYWALAKVFLMPGAVGLVILDSFALETPMITTAVPTHGPEIDYLENGVNGIMVTARDSVSDFANAAVHILQDEEERQLLVKGCRRSAPKYTVEKSAQLFADGIQSALQVRHYCG